MLSSLTLGVLKKRIWWSNGEKLRILNRRASRDDCMLTCYMSTHQLKNMLLLYKCFTFSTTYKQNCSWDMRRLQNGKNPFIYLRSINNLIGCRMHPHLLNSTNVFVCLRIYITSLSGITGTLFWEEHQLGRCISLQGCFYGSKPV